MEIPLNLPGSPRDAPLHGGPGAGPRGRSHGFYGLDCDGFFVDFRMFFRMFMMVYDGWWWLMIVSMMELKWWLRDDLFMMICMIVYDGFWLFMMVCVFEMFGGCDWDLRRCKSEVLGELLRQKWQDSLRCLMSWGQISDHPKGIVGMIPKSGQIASFDLFGIWGWNSCWSQWHEAAEWVNLLGIPEIHSDLPWLPWPLKRHESTFTVKIYTRLLQAMSVGCFYMFHPNLHLAS